MADALLNLLAFQHMHWLFPAKDKTQSGDVFQRKTEHVLTIDLWHDAQQHCQNHLQSRTKTTDIHHRSRVQRTLRRISRVLKRKLWPNELNCLEALYVTKQQCGAEENLRLWLSNALKHLEFCRLLTNGKITETQREATETTVFRMILTKMQSNFCSCLFL